MLHLIMCMIVCLLVPLRLREAMKKNYKIVDIVNSDVQKTSPPSAQVAAVTAMQQQKHKQNILETPLKLS